MLNLSSLVQDLESTNVYLVIMDVSIENSVSCC